jgi:peroxiredoxin
MNEQSNNSLRVGDKMADLTLPALDGGAFHLQDLHGKKYILFMWASW